MVASVERTSPLKLLGQFQLISINFMVIFEWTLMLVFDLNCDEWMDRWQPECPILHLAKTGAPQKGSLFIGINTICNKLEALWSSG